MSEPENQIFEIQDQLEGEHVEQIDSKDVMDGQQKNELEAMKMAIENTRRLAKCHQRAVEILISLCSSQTDQGCMIHCF